MMRGMLAGLARVPFDGFVPDLGMLGWGQPGQRMKGVARSLAARALVLEHRGLRWGLCALDLCLVDRALRDSVRTEVGESPGALTLTATHTHSGPAGFVTAPFYALEGPDPAPALRERVVAAAAQALVEAAGALAPARLAWGEAEVARGVAFCRSPAAYRRNPEARTRPDPVDRTLRLLRIDAPDGTPRGAVMLFGLHATSIHADVPFLHPDHPGLAADRLGARVRHLRGGDPAFVALFLQGAAGDVSPNRRFDPRRGVTVDPVHRDDFLAAERVAAAEVEAGLTAFDAARPAPEELVVRTAVEDFEGRPTADGPTTRARLGVGMARGTAEGPGPLRGLGAPRRNPFASDPKIPMLEVGPGGDRRVLRAVFEGLPHPLREAILEAARAPGGLIDTVLPVQWVELGGRGLLLLPNEPTSTAARRLRAALGGETDVLGYANAYSGYLTTPEEYGEQDYEGAYTLFGPNTLAAYRDLALRLRRRGPSP
jgi:neutral ceramidase